MLTGELDINHIQGRFRRTIRRLLPCTCLQIELFVSESGRQGQNFLQGAFLEEREESVSSENWAEYVGGEGSVEVSQERFSVRAGIIVINCSSGEYPRVKRMGQDGAYN